MEAKKLLAGWFHSGVRVKVKRPGENTLHTLLEDGEKVIVSVWGPGHAGAGATPGSNHPVTLPPNIFTLWNLKLK